MGRNASGRARRSRSSPSRHGRPFSLGDADRLMLRGYALGNAPVSRTGAGFSAYQLLVVLNGEALSPLECLGISSEVLAHVGDRIGAAPEQPPDMSRIA